MLVEEKNTISGGGRVQGCSGSRTVAPGLTEMQILGLSYSDYLAELT